MKIVIDIDENVFTRLFDNGTEDYAIVNDDLFSIAKAIRNGTPISTEGDLISREALKETIIEPLNVNDACKNDWYEGYYTAKNEDIMAIDNAPTVSFMISPDYVTELQNRNKELIKQLEEETRPQGEWIDTGSGQECNKCHEIQYGYDSFRHFCPNCGARMQ
jgi:hypothetical protein